MAVGSFPHAVAVAGYPRIDESVIVDDSDSEPAPGTAIAGFTLGADASYTTLSDSTDQGDYVKNVNDAHDVWVERTIDSGALQSDGIGSSRVRLNSDRSCSCTDPGQTTCTLTLDFYTASSGGTLIGSKQITLTATQS